MPELIFPSNCFVGIQPTCFVCIFCNPSRNGRSLMTPARTLTDTHGAGSGSANPLSLQSAVGVIQGDRM
jgi:hypothetical protein